MMPMVLGYVDTDIQAPDYYTLQIQTTDWSETLAKVKRAYQSIEPVVPFEYNFLNERLADFYRADESRGILFLAFSIGIIVIACMGLFALVSFSVERRTREISIRKALGATVSDIISTIGREFVGIILLAILVALPLAWYIMNQWLNEFAYRIVPGIGLFLLAAGLAVLIATITITARTFGAARANPVKWLRTD